MDKLSVNDIIKEIYIGWAGEDMVYKGDFDEDISKHTQSILDLLPGEEEIEKLLIAQSVYGSIRTAKELAQAILKDIKERMR